MTAPVPPANIIDIGTDTDAGAWLAMLPHCLNIAVSEYTRPVAALFVEPAGCYAGLPGVDMWDEARDARLYAGPHPVVAHPPCDRWGRYWAGSPYAIANGFPRKRKGDDGGCFAHALDTLRKFGGVAEHPADSAAWDHFGLNKPPRSGGWIVADWFGGWTCYVEQGFYGHFSRKPTWLLAYHCELPSLRWGEGEQRIPEGAIERFGYAKARRRGVMVNVGGGGDDRERSATPLPFRDLLLSIARTATRACSTSRDPARRGEDQNASTGLSLNTQLHDEPNATEAQA